MTREPGLTRRLSIDLVSGAVRRVPVSAKCIDYLLAYDEPWARSYAQYVVTKSGDARLLGDIDSRRGDSPAAKATPAQWNDVDFVPVLDTIDVLSKGVGWIR